LSPPMMCDAEKEKRLDIVYMGPQFGRSARAPHPNKKGSNARYEGQQGQRNRPGRMVGMMGSLFYPGRPRPGRHQ
jgi:hypothetical protein